MPDLIDASRLYRGLFLRLPERVQLGEAWAEIAQCSGTSNFDSTQQDEEKAARASTHLRRRC